MTIEGIKYFDREDDRWPATRGNHTDEKAIERVNALPEEIREHVRRNIETLSSACGGFVFTQVHNIQQDVPVENVEAMFAAAYEFG